MATWSLATRPWQCALCTRQDRRLHLAEQKNNAWHPEHRCVAPPSPHHAHEGIWLFWTTKKNNGVEALLSLTFCFRVLRTQRLASQHGC
mmetsp:Transcript_3430/g.11268  ORF Transcript_3430/g.11268 Transcript_3430/m.11268 type:complete len:89 (+) Transcript_3430:1716-1982(+)